MPYLWRHLRLEILSTPLEDSLKPSATKIKHLSFFEIPQVPFAFEFETERLNGNSAKKQSLNYHSLDLDKVGQMANWQFRDKTFAKLPFDYSTDFS